MHTAQDLYSTAMAVLLVLVPVTSAYLLHEVIYQSNIHINISTVSYLYTVVEMKAENCVSCL